MQGKQQDSAWAVAGCRWSEREARMALAAFECSGLSMEAFAREHGFSAQRLRWWRARLPAPPTPELKSAAATTSFLPVVVRGGFDRPQVAVLIRVGAAEIQVSRPDVVDPKWLACVVATMGAER